MDETNISLVDDKKERLLQSSDKAEIEQIIALINTDIVKRNAIRSTVYSDMIDKIIDEIGGRLSKYPGQFSNKDLLDYLNAMQNNLRNNQIDSDNLPKIAIQNNNIININPLSNFDRESKDRMREALKSIFAHNSMTKQQEVEVIESDIDKKTE